jgi:REP element-mobilizing transposase RayT
VRLKGYDYPFIQIRRFELVPFKRTSRFSWQSRFYDHIICDEKGLNTIRKYIQNNPAQWDYERNDQSEL